MILAIKWFEGYVLNGYRNKTYGCPINMKQIQRWEAIAYLIGHSSCIHDRCTNAEKAKTRSSRLQNAEGDNTRNSIIVFMRAGLAGVDGDWWLHYKFHCARLMPVVKAQSIHLEGGEQIQLQWSETTFPQNVEDSTLVRYLKRPEIYSILCFLDFYEQMRLYKTCPASLNFLCSSLPRDFPFPRKYFAKRGAISSNV